ncbi:hypothetical protein [Enterococcus sp. CSURQ0835]|uniref:hypothetical protein n=1 Tax=Enterococcus sp. CSURQ0835 TaxID=2681394 RepID=UPI00135786EE|nr:hypothetical protein [Enterococcus sp. CSURQ0835]
MLKILNIVIYTFYLIIGTSVGLLIKIGYETKAAAIPQPLWTFIFIMTLFLVFFHAVRAVLRQQIKLQKDVIPQATRSARLKKRVKVKPVMNKSARLTFKNLRKLAQRKKRLT